MTNREELILLDKIKSELMEKSLFIVSRDEYMITIADGTWHDIFKTEEFNALMKKERDEFQGL